MLTWTKNRRIFDESLARLWRQASSDARPIAIMLIDIDDFEASMDARDPVGSSHLRSVRT
ncbi:MAG: diguanylate cyclase domain-containing protein [Steroidobacteraceae bacterium]